MSEEKGLRSQKYDPPLPPRPHAELLVFQPWPDHGRPGGSGGALHRAHLGHALSSRLLLLRTRDVRLIQCHIIYAVLKTLSLNFSPPSLPPVATFLSATKVPTSSPRSRCGWVWFQKALTEFLSTPPMPTGKPHPLTTPPRVKGHATSCMYVCPCRFSTSYQSSLGNTIGASGVVRLISLLFSRSELLSHCSPRSSSVLPLLPSHERLCGVLEGEGGEGVKV